MTKETIIKAVAVVLGLITPAMLIYLAICFVTWSVPHLSDFSSKDRAGFLFGWITFCTIIVPVIFWFANVICVPIKRREREASNEPNHEPERWK